MRAQRLKSDRADGPGKVPAESIFPSSGSMGALSFPAGAPREAHAEVMVRLLKVLPFTLLRAFRRSWMRTDALLTLAHPCLRVVGFFPPIWKFYLDYWCFYQLMVVYFMMLPNLIQIFLEFCSPKVIKDYEEKKKAFSFFRYTPRSQYASYYEKQRIAFSVFWQNLAKSLFSLLSLYHMLKNLCLSTDCWST